ncbi:hypothetical protein AB6A40_011659 [Gnathostoma spinigerum]|uniref:Uncharacterized protein n=1 Tax=Gnathostoma spinigerum TaxID=75299 RepID=A0ABD6EYB1_9BILA
MIFSSSGLSPSSVIISGNMEKSTSEGLSSSSPSIAGASGTACMQPCPSPATAQVQQSSPSAAQSQPQPSGGTSAADWTTQLKNDLRIGSNSGGVASVPTTSQSSTLTQVLTAPQPRSISSSISPQQQGATKSNMIVSNSQASAAVATTPTANHMTSSQVSHTVEFVSGDSNNSTSLPEYQFGFHVDSAATNTEDSVDTAYSSNVQNHAISSQQTKSEAELSVPVSSSTVTNGPVGDYSNTAQQQSKVC